MIDTLQNMYNNQLSEISSQQSPETTRRVSTNTKPGTTDSKARNSELKEVAKEMESVFAYQMIKEMRKTSDSMSSKNDLGSDTYMSMFDIEISKLFAEKGLGLQDALMRWLERAPNTTADINDIDDSVNIPEPEGSKKPELL